MIFSVDLVSDNATQTEAWNNANETMSTLLTVAAKNGLTDVVDELVHVLLNGTITVSKDTITAASKIANESGFQEVVEILKNNEVHILLSNKTRRVQYKMNLFAMI